MKIYLAGKIASNGWREAILLPGTMDKARLQVRTKNWPIIQNAVLGQHDYVGPYFIPNEGFNHDPGFHGADNHGVDATGNRNEWVHEEHAPMGYTQDEVVSLCLESILRADVVFAWLDRCDAYGTLVELGFASAHQKPILIGYPSWERDLWFAWHLSQFHSCAMSPRTALTNLLTHVQPEPEPIPEMKIDGYVYLLESGGVHKIGRAKVVDNRIKQIQPKLPHPINLIHTIPCTNMARAEFELHTRYKDCRLQGEWFNLTDQAVEDICRIKQIVSATPTPVARLSAYPAGMKVRHAAFGEGIVVRSQPDGNDHKVTVAFVGNGVREMLAGLAKLEKVVR